MTATNNILILLGSSAVRYRNGYKFLLGLYGACVWVVGVRDQVNDPRGDGVAQTSPPLRARPKQTSDTLYSHGRLSHAHAA